MLTRVKGAHKAVILKIVPHTRQIEGDRNVELVQYCGGTKSRELKDLGRVQRSGSDDDFSCSIHYLTWCGGVGRELVQI
jgi:hypothetical protein